MTSSSFQLTFCDVSENRTVVVVVVQHVPSSLELKMRLEALRRTMGTMSRSGYDRARMPGRMSRTARMAKEKARHSASTSSARRMACSSPGPMRRPVRSLIKAANWLTHLEYEWESPVWRHWIRFFCRPLPLRAVRRARLRDERLERRRSLLRAVASADLEAVVAAAAPARARSPCSASRRARRRAIAYAVRHPERVSHLVLYGGYARGWAHRGDPDRKREYEAIVDLVRFGWGRDNPAFRQVFTSRFIPGATSEQMDWFNELCRKTTSPAIAAELMEARAEVDVGRCPGEGPDPDAGHPRAGRPGRADRREARLIASGIPGARVRRAGLEEPHPARGRAGLGAVLRRRPRVHRNRARATVGEDRRLRRRSPGASVEVLALLTEGLGNADIAERLSPEREDGPQPHLEPLRQARRLDASPGDRLRARPGLSPLLAATG